MEYHGHNIRFFKMTYYLAMGHIKFFLWMEETLSFGRTQDSLSFSPCKFPDDIVNTS